MKTFILTLFLLVCLKLNVMAYNVFYDSTTLLVSGGFGNVDADKYLADYPNLRLVFIKDSDPIIKNPPEYLKYDSNLKTVVLRPASELTNVQTAIQVAVLKNKIVSLQSDYLHAINAIANGFSVFVDTTALKSQIITLQQQYSIINVTVP